MTFGTTILAEACLLALCLLPALLSYQKGRSSNLALGFAAGYLIFLAVVATAQWPCPIQRNEEGLWFWLPMGFLVFPAIPIIKIIPFTWPSIVCLLILASVGTAQFAFIGWVVKRAW